MLRNLIWFREDLRISDNLALHHATKNADVIAIYIIDAKMWQQHDMAACRVEFILRGLTALSAELSKLNIPLIIESIQSEEKIQEKIFQLLTKFNAQALYFNQQYEIDELKRDQTVIKYLATKNISCYVYHDQTILPPGSIVNQQGEYFKVFTAYKRAWLKQFLQRNIKLYPKPKKQNKLKIKSSKVPIKVSTFKSNVDPELWPAGGKQAQNALKNFVENKILKYDRQRDFPAIDSTSKLSPYLSCGMISARECFSAALAMNHNEIDSGNKDILTWLNELIWRDFYKHILVSVPRVAMGKAYKLETENIPWNYDQKLLTAWQQGKTGFPVIDAAMRQLNQTGWMHNRLRMIVAMFLAKNLLLDWRLGEKYFIQHLIDGDLAANNGGWQWCASTGTDAVPYFRIFNPITQSERFDPKGDFIRQYCPELAELNNKAIHDPHTRAPELLRKINYPKPIINLKLSRERALAAFKKIK